MVAEKRRVELSLSILEDKPKITVAVAFEKFVAQLPDSEAAVHVRLAETVEQITQSKQALHPLVLRQAAEASDDGRINGEKSTQRAS